MVRLLPVTPVLRLLPVAAACLLAAWALRVSAQQPPVAPVDEEQLPVTVEARELKGRPDQEMVAEGDVELKRGATSIRADRIVYDTPKGLAKAYGNVRISRDGNVFSGPELQLQLERYEGFFTNPTYFFAVTQAGGQAERLDFLGQRRVAAIRATYSSCTPDDEGDYAWLLKGRHVTLDFENDVGTAEGGVLTFYGVPILASPYLSFPLSSKRKSGWLPPTPAFDSKSGFELGVPYYWNIAPNLDATLTPSIITKRGGALGTQFRYLQPDYQGELNLHLLPNDRVWGGSRHSVYLRHDGRLPMEGTYAVGINRVSDDDYWKDLERNIPGLTPRLLPGEARANWWLGDWQVYSRVQRWQVLQDPTAPIISPYNREPQVGLRRAHDLGFGLRASLETEINRFTLHQSADENIGRPDATRVHALGSLSWSVVDRPGWFLTPKLSINAASYDIDASSSGPRRRVSRTIPTVSIDNGWVFERNSTWFGRAYVQTLEPRLLYVRTPYRNQDDVPVFDSAAKDFNLTTLFTPNPFSGVDRVSDGHHLTFGGYSRFLDAATGAEALRLGIAQRNLFDRQRITPEGVPFNERFSDVLLLASTDSLIPNWSLSATTQYNPDTRRTVRSTLGVRYTPGNFRTVGASYSHTRRASEQVDVGWQWPVYRGRPSDTGGPACVGSLYTIGRANYSVMERRLTESLFGFEYDAGCWIGRFAVERRSISRDDATTRLMFQIEFVGLSRLGFGANPMQASKDTIPGYQPLRPE
ncbi:LPS-assembly protein LptD [Caldimonas brevitalea]|uniref:LPS-assembly protein LptD n=1 Tax=Caldimonas brevitalea TaxID=413882 RepID=A0A0G3BC62_9BURK|nr:LPS-assembly protein LptD [Caldimonas brevitalea]AKJ26954.1 organic solvent tolerance protein [Caldimonas brevitalea]